MSINRKLVVAAVAGLTLGATSCRKYLDVNDNPNIAHNVTVQTLLPASELYIGSAIGVDMQINGSIWAQFWTQSPDGKQYIPLEQFTPKDEAYSVGWENLYTGASNFYQLYKIAEEQHKEQYRAISMIMQSYAFQAAADAWGDVPYSEALKGQYPDGHIVNPKYDSQRVVYKGIVATLDSALKLINPNDAARPGSDDIIYGGNMTKWMKFANTLKLRALLRMSKADPLYANGKIDTMFRKNAMFIGNGDDATIAYGAGTTNNNPLYAELSSVNMGGVQQLAGSKTVIDSLRANNDYRGAVFFNIVNGLGIVGVTQSEYDITLPAGSFSAPNVYVGAAAMQSASAAAPVHLLTSWESYFLQAEAVAKGYTAGDDAQLFYQGINASFNYYSSAIASETGVTGSVAYNIYINGDVPNAIPAGYWTAYPTTGTINEKMRFIITQKWFAMCGNQGFEAWTEWRRTGYPDFLITPRNSFIGTDAALRFLYPATEKATNSQYPGLMPLTQAVWWDVQ